MKVRDLLNDSTIVEIVSSLFRQRIRDKSIGGLLTEVAPAVTVRGFLTSAIAETEVVAVEPKMVSYMVATGYNVDDLEQQVVNAMADGWQCQGGVSVTKLTERTGTNDREVERWMQALVKV